MLNCYEERVGGGDVRTVYADTFACCRMPSVFPEIAIERSHRRKGNYVLIPLLEAQNSVLDVASRIRSTGEIPSKDAADDVVGAVVTVNENCDLKHAIDVGEIDKGVVRRLHQDLQQSYRDK